MAMSYYRGDHDFDNGDGGVTDVGVCVVEEHIKYSDTWRPCGRPASSAVHPPDQFRHWCTTLEQGGDCMHFEDSDA